MHLTQSPYTSPSRDWDNIVAIRIRLWYFCPLLIQAHALNPLNPLNPLAQVGVSLRMRQSFVLSF